MKDKKRKKNFRNIRMDVFFFVINIFKQQPKYNDDDDGMNTS